MKAEFVSPFIVDCQNIFREVTEIDLIYGGATAKSSSVPIQNVVVLIGITGDLKGSIILNLKEEFAMKIASNMMGGIEVVEFNELAKSAIAELVNMIMGRFSTTLANKQITIDITPPSLMTGKGIVLTVEKPILSIKFFYDNYDLDFDISIKNLIPC